MAERIAALAGTSAPPISPIPHPQTMTTLHRQETPLPRPQYVISEDTAAITWIKPRAKRGVFIGQGRNRILLSPKLIAVVLELDPAQEPKDRPVSSTATPQRPDLSDTQQGRTDHQAEYVSHAEVLDQGALPGGAPSSTPI